MVKTILMGIDNLNEVNTEERLLSKLMEIPAVEKCSYDSNCKLLKLSYDSHSLSHANYIYEFIEDLGYIVK